MNKLQINMIARGVDVPGQGVGSAFKEQVRLLETRASDTLEVVRGAWRDGDINHFNTVDPLSFLRLMRTRVPSVMHVHFLPDTLDGSIRLPRLFDWVFKRYVRAFYRRPDRLVVVNPTFREPLAALGIDPAKVHYIPNYVSDEYFGKDEPEQVAKLRKIYGVGRKDFVVLGVGQVQTRKGVRDFVEVAKACPELRFVWCGGFSFGGITDGYDELKQLVEHPPANVTFTGIIPREHMNGYYQMADCVFLPSYHELFPMAILEASQCHVPLVLRDLELYEEILMGNYLARTDNAGFAEALRQLAGDPALRATYRDRSRALAKTYSAEYVAGMWVDFYTETARRQR